MEEFAPKGEETLKQEVLADLGLEYTGNEEVVDKVVARLKVEEEFKAGVHKQKKDHQTKSKQREEWLKKLGVDPETGEKLAANADGAKDTKNEKDLSSDDLYALMEAKVSREDVSEVKKAAAVLGLSIAEALNSPIVKSILKTKLEERTTAQATNTNQTRTKVSHTETILKKTEKQEDMTDDEIKEGARLLVEEMANKK